MRLYRLALLTAPLLNVTACHKKASGHADQAPVHHLFTHGDPLQLVSGVTGDGQSFLQTAHAADYAGFVLASGEILQQRSEAADSTPATTASLESANAATNLDLRLDVQIPYSFVADGAVMHYKPVSGDDQLGLDFVDQNGTLVVQKLSGLPVTPIAYSLRADGEAFSLLFSATDATDGNVLVALYFNKQHKDAAPLADVSQDYHFLLGPGVVTKWNEDINVAICGQVDDGEDAEFRAGITAWANSGLIGQKKLTISRADASLPFTDMNTHCISMVDDFLFENDPTEAVMGYTTSVLDHNRQQVLASHIFISRSAFTKIFGGFLDPYGNDQLQRTVTHEFGHFLGLDHEFVKNADGSYKFPSIMSYDPQEFGVKSHDIESMTLLYGAYPTTGAMGTMATPATAAAPTTAAPSGTAAAAPEAT